MLCHYRHFRALTAEDLSVLLETPIAKKHPMEQQRRLWQHRMTPLLPSWNSMCCQLKLEKCLTFTPTAQPIFALPVLVQYRSE